MVFIGLCSLMSFTSCSDDNTAMIPVTTVEPVTVTVKLPEGLRSRAGEKYFGDGSKVNRLRYSLYRANGTIAYSSEMTQAPKPTLSYNQDWELTLHLIKEESYTLFFWADYYDSAKEEFYDLNFQAKEVSFNSTGNYSDDKTGDGEYRDAFYCYQQFIAGQTTSFMLKRPLAHVVVKSDFTNEDYNKFCEANDVDDIITYCGMSKEGTSPLTLSSKNR